MKFSDEEKWRKFITLRPALKQWRGSSLNTREMMEKGIFKDQEGKNTTETREMLVETTDLPPPPEVLGVFFVCFSFGCC